jgi:hypothetical protein
VGHPLSISMEVTDMARRTNFTRRLGTFGMALILALGILGSQAVGASSISNQPPILQPGGGQQPGICYVCFNGITSISEKTLFHMSNYPDKASVEMAFTFTGNEASVSYAVQPASAPNPPTPGEYWNMPLQNSGQYAAYEIFTVGTQHRFFVKVVDTNGNTYTKELTFWVS